MSIFLDFKIEIVGDVLSLLFAVDLSLSETTGKNGTTFSFQNPMLQDFIRKWCQFKNVYEKEKAEILAITDEQKRKEELDKLEATRQEWQLRAMGTTIGCQTIVTKGTDRNSIKAFDLT